MKLAGPVLGRSPGILDRYLVRTCAASIGVVFVGLVAVVVAVHLIEQAGSLTAHGTATTLLRLAAYQAVVQGADVLPIAAFFGVLTATTLLARSGELLAMQAAGASPRRLVAAALGAPLVCAVLGAVVAEVAVPRSLAAIERIYLDELEKGQGRLGSFFTRQQRWFSFGDQVLYLPAAGRGEAAFEHPVVFRFHDGLIREVIEAESLRYQDGAWVLRGAHDHDAIAGRTTIVAEAPLDLDVEPQDLLEVTGNPRHLSTPEVDALIDRRARAGFDTVIHRVGRIERFAHPTLGLWLLLLAAPWLFAPGTRRSLAITLGAGVAAFAAVLALGQSLRLLALAGRTAPVVGALGGAIACLVLLPASVALARWFRGRGTGTGATDPR